MIGALVVVIDHSAPLTDSSRLTVFPNSWNLSPGYIALMGFFAMSGYQISDSWRQDPSWLRFSAKRVLRLWPPLLVVVLVTALVIGPLVSTLDLAEYFSARGTWGYIVHNAGLYTLQHRLPGVFDHNPWPWSANGAIWTLPMELTGYLLVLGFGVAGLFRRAPWLTVVLMLALIGLDRRFDASIGNPGHGGSFLQVPIGSLVAFLGAARLPGQDPAVAFRGMVAGRPPDRRAHHQRRSGDASVHGRLWGAGTGLSLAGPARGLRRVGVR
jgi:peptidoglycan/LPS O-acetylase OafA/YrhL